MAEKIAGCHFPTLNNFNISGRENSTTAVQVSAAPYKPT